MNKTYRVVYNRARGLATAVSEITTSNQARKKTLSSVVSAGLASMVLGFASQVAVASIPEGVSVARNGAPETITESDSATVSGVPLWTKTITDDEMHWRFNHKDPSLVDYKTQIEAINEHALIGDAYYSGSTGTKGYSSASVTGNDFVIGIHGDHGSKEYTDLTELTVQGKTLTSGVVVGDSGSIQFDKSFVVNVTNEKTTDFSAAMLIFGSTLQAKGLTLNSTGVLNGLEIHSGKIDSTLVPSSGTVDGDISISLSSTNQVGLIEDLLDGKSSVHIDVDGLDVSNSTLNVTGNIDVTTTATDEFLAGVKTAIPTSQYEGVYGLPVWVGEGGTLSVTGNLRSESIGEYDIANGLSIGEFSSGKETKMKIDGDLTLAVGVKDGSKKPIEAHGIWIDAEGAEYTGAATLEVGGKTTINVSGQEFAAGVWERGLELGNATVVLGQAELKAVSTSGAAVGVYVGKGNTFASAGDVKIDVKGGGASETGQGFFLPTGAEILGGAQMQVGTQEQQADLSLSVTGPVGCGLAIDQADTSPENKSKLTVSGDLTIEAHYDDSIQKYQSYFEKERQMALYVHLGELTVNGKTTIKAENTGTLTLEEGDGDSLVGLRIHNDGSQVTFNGDAEISAIAMSMKVKAVDTDNSINFNGVKTKLIAETSGTGVAGVGDATALKTHGSTDIQAKALELEARGAEASIAYEYSFNDALDTQSLKVTADKGLLSIGLFNAEGICNYGLKTDGTISTKFVSLGSKYKDASLVTSSIQVADTLDVDVSTTGTGVYRDNFSGAYGVSMYGDKLTVGGKANVTANAANGDAVALHLGQSLKVSDTKDPSTSKDKYLLEETTGSGASVMLNGGATLKASTTASGAHSIGVYVSKDSVLTVAGGLTVDAEYAFAGNGTVNVDGGLTLGKSKATAFEGTVNLTNGKAALSADTGYFKKASAVSVGKDAELDVAASSASAQDLANLTVSSGTLVASTAQLFTKALDSEGSTVTNPEGWAWANGASATGSLTISDAYFNLPYKKHAEALNSNLTFTWNGLCVDVKEITPEVIGDLKDKDGNLNTPNIAVNYSNEGSFVVSSETGADVQGNANVLSVNVGSSGSIEVNSQSLTLQSFTSGSMTVTGSETNQGSLVVSGGTADIASTVQASGNSKVTISGNYNFQNSFAIAGNAQLNVSGQTSFASLTTNDSANILFSGTNSTIGTLDASKGSGSIKVVQASSLIFNKISLGSGYTMNVGVAGEKEGHLVATFFTLAGILVFDPDWTQSPSTGAIESVTFNPNAQLRVAQNSIVTLGSSKEKTASDIAALGETFGQGNIQAALFLDAPIALGGAGVIVDGLSDGTTAAQAGKLIVKDKGLLVGRITDPSTKVIDGALEVESGATVLADLRDYEGTEETFSFASSVVAAEDSLLKVNGLFYDPTWNSDGTFSAKYNPIKKIETVYGGLVGGKTFTAALISKGEANDRVKEIVYNTGASVETRDALNKISLVGTGSAAQVMGINMADMVARSIDNRASLAAQANGANDGLWVTADYMNSKASSYSVGSTKYGYNGHLAGLSLGVDHTGAQGTIGLAASVGSGESKGKSTASGIKNTIKYYGATLYAASSAENPVRAFGSLGYHVAKDKVKSEGYSVKPDVKVFTADFKLEAPLAMSGDTSIVPHVGVRYINVDTDSFTMGGFKYDSGRVGLVKFPVGVAISTKGKTEGGSDVRGFADLSAVPVAGDSTVKNGLGLASGAILDTFEARVANKIMGELNLGFSVENKAHRFGLSYGLGLGDNSRQDHKFKANYRYSF